MCAIFAGWSRWERPLLSRLVIRTETKRGSATTAISVHVDETLVPAPKLNQYYIATRRLSHRSSHAIPHMTFDDVEERERGERKTDRLSHAFTRNLGSTQQTTYTMSCLVDLYNSLTCAHKKGIL
jgi:hypothetical protein